MRNLSAGIYLTVIAVVMISGLFCESSNESHRESFLFSVDEFRSDPSAPAYYVDSQKGSDSADGRSPGTAWKSLWKVCDVKLVPGDVVRLKRGSVWENQALFFNRKYSGEEGRPIIIEAYGQGNPPVILKPKNYYKRTDEFSGVYFGSGSAYFHLLDIRIVDAVSGPAILMTSLTNHIVVAGTEVSGSGAGIGICGEHQRVIANYVHDMVMVLDTGDGGKDWGANGVTVYGRDIEIAWNRFINCIAPSKAFGTDGGAVEFFGYQPPEEGTLGWNYVSDDIRIHHNHIDKCEGFLEGAGKVKNMKVAYNLYENNKHTAFVLHLNTITDGYFQMEISNNTFISHDKNQWGEGFIIQYVKKDTTEAELAENLIAVRNNIFATDSTITKWMNRLGDRLIHEHNLYYFFGTGGINGDNGGNWTLGPTERIADPCFTAAGSRNYRPGAGSPAIDAGGPALFNYDLDNHPVPSGNGPDIGAYESM